MTFTGKNIGEKIARSWNMGLKKIHEPCLVCGVDCANPIDLARHKANKHANQHQENAA